MKTDPTRVNGLHKAFICGLNQFLCFFIHMSHKEGFIEVTVKTIVVDCDVHCVKAMMRNMSAPILLCDTCYYF